MIEFYCFSYFFFFKKNEHSDSDSDMDPKLDRGLPALPALQSRVRKERLRYLHHTPFTTQGCYLFIFKLTILTKKTNPILVSHPD
jgi:hypothetical protein